jgi:hypothetical protein
MPAVAVVLVTREAPVLAVLAAAVRVARLTARMGLRISEVGAGALLVQTLPAPAAAVLSSWQFAQRNQSTIR